MKFKKITLCNFMRYKGENVIEFSCDPQKNVTIVMGDNTFGKTTLAQAFRWGLYGNTIDTQYGKSKDVILLNNDLVKSAPINREETVSVELEIIEGEYVYQFKREATFVKKNSTDVKQTQEKLWMRMKRENDKWGDWIDNDTADRKNNNCANEAIRMMFPPELASYFFFDGEKWSDSKKTNIEIKNSISSLMGITPLLKMKEHLSNGSRVSVIKKLEGRISGTERYTDIKQNKLDKERQIERWRSEIEEHNKNAEIFAEKVNKANEWLRSNEKIGEYQKEYDNLIRNISPQKKSMESHYADIVKRFSSDAYKYFGATLCNDVIELLKSVNLEGKDIPDITASTLDYLLQEKVCLCGNPICDKEHAYIEELRKLIPPNVIGSYVGQYKDKLEGWKIDTNNLVDDIKEKALLIEGIRSQIEEDEERIDKLEKIIDGKVNFAQERSKMKANENNMNSELRKALDKEKWISEAEEIIKRYDEELKREATHTKENERINRMIEYAQRLYSKTSSILKSKEEPLMDELNEIIANKFDEMFKEKEKVARIGSDYKLHLFYKDSDVEELTLSQGEIVARNFVFIVSVLELAKIKKMEDMQETNKSDVLNLPLVLDGPFSKLSEDNTKLVAKALPGAAEQVIVFMLDKDWESSDLDKYTLPEFRYYVSKDVSSNSSEIRRR